MNRTEFIKLIIDKGSLNKEVYALSLKIDNFPIARQVLNKISGNLNLDLILKSNKLIDINIAKGDLIANTVYFIDDSRLKSETKRFIEDLVDQKILGSNFEKKEITNHKNKKNKEIKNTYQNQLIPDPWDSILKEKTDKQIVNNKNSKTTPNSENNSKLNKKENIYKPILNNEKSQTNKSLEKKEVKSTNFANASINREKRIREAMNVFLPLSFFLVMFGICMRGFFIYYVPNTKNNKNNLSNNFTELKNNINSTKKIYYS